MAFAIGVGELEIGGSLAHRDRHSPEAIPSTTDG
jgi:hypothetical protein